MQSPFALFRKHQKVLMVAVTGLAMFAFVILDAGSAGSGGFSATQFTLLIAAGCGGVMWLIGLRQGKGTEFALGGAVAGAVIAFVLFSAGGPKPAVETAAGDLSFRELQQLVNERQAANQFLLQAHDTAVPMPIELPEQFAQFRDNPFMAQQLLQRFQQQWLAQRRMVVFDYEPVLPPADDLDDRERMERDVLFGYLLEREADRMGVRISNANVSAFIDGVTQNKLSVPAFRTILRDRGMSQAALYDIIRRQLKARRALELALPPELATPQRYWELYKRLNVRQQLEVTAVPVDEFTTLVPDPSKDELAAFFDKHKDVYDDANGDGSPGLKQRRKVSLSYLEADPASFEPDVTRKAEEEIVDADQRAILREAVETNLRSTLSSDDELKNERLDKLLEAETLDVDAIRLLALDDEKLRKHEGALDTYDALTALLETTGELKRIDYDIREYYENRKEFLYKNRILEDDATTSLPEEKVIPDEKPGEPDDGGEKSGNEKAEEKSSEKKPAAKKGGDEKTPLDPEFQPGKKPADEDGAKKNPAKNPADKAAAKKPSTEAGKIEPKKTPSKADTKTKPKKPAVPPTDAGKPKEKIENKQSAVLDKAGEFEVALADLPVASAGTRLAGEIVAAALQPDTKTKPADGKKKPIPDPPPPKKTDGPKLPGGPSLTTPNEPPPPALPSESGTGNEDEPIASEPPPPPLPVPRSDDITPLPKYIPFAEKRDEIRETLLRERTQAEVKARIEAAKEMMDLLSFESPAAPEGDAKRLTGAQIDRRLREYAAKHGLHFGTTPLLPARQLADPTEYPIGQTMSEDQVVSLQMGRPVTRTVDQLFEQGNTRTYAAAIAVDPDADTQFAYWKTEDVPAHVPLYRALEVNSSIEITKLNERLGYDWIPPESTQATRLERYLTARFGGLPRQGESLTWRNLRVTTVKAGETEATLRIDEPGIPALTRDLWKRTQAQPLAEARARKLAELVRKKKEPLEIALSGESVTGNKDGLLLTFRHTGAFPWLSRSMAPSPGMMGPPQAGPPEVTRLSADGIENAGEGFMEYVFDDLANGEVGSVANRDRSVWYVVRVVQRTPLDPESDQAFKDAFLKEEIEQSETGQPTPYEFLIRRERQQMIQDWSEQLLRKYQVEWIDTTSVQ